MELVAELAEEPELRRTLEELPVDVPVLVVLRRTFEVLLVEDVPVVLRLTCEEEPVEELLPVLVVLRRTCEDELPVEYVPVPVVLRLTCEEEPVEELLPVLVVLRRTCEEELPVEYVPAPVVLRLICEEEPVEELLRPVLVVLLLTCEDEPERVVVDVVLFVLVLLRTCASISLQGAANRAAEAINAIVMLRKFFITDIVLEFSGNATFPRPGNVDCHQ